MVPLLMYVGSGRSAWVCSLPPERCGWQPHWVIICVAGSLGKGHPGSWLSQAIAGAEVPHWRSSHALATRCISI